MFHYGLGRSIHFCAFSLSFQKTPNYNCRLSIITCRISPANRKVSFPHSRSPKPEPGSPSCSAYRQSNVPSKAISSVRVRRDELWVVCLYISPSESVVSSPPKSDTIRSLIDGLSEDERADALLIVMVAEPWDLDFSRKVHAEVNDAFADHLESGLLEVITPHSSFYPNLDNLKAGP